MNIKDCKSYAEDEYETRSYILLKSLKWYEDNAYRNDDFFWFDEDEYNKWLSGSRCDMPSFIPAMHIDDVLNGISMWDEKYQNSFSSYCWGSEREITVETDPEYFI